jgi:flagellar biosynthesis/type III secretory pathway protein FliH
MQATPWALDELAMPDIFAMSDEPRLVGASGDNSADTYAHLAAERTRLEADAYNRGYADAERAAHANAESHVSAALTALADAIASVQLHDARWTANTEENLAALAVAVARHIVQREVIADPTIVRELVQRALAQIPMDNAVTVRLHPDDAATCNSLATPDAAGRVQDIRIIADGHITRGGCLVEGRERIIDGRVDTSLERAYRAIGQIQA